MITIDRMETEFRLAGQPAARAHLARRLDRIVQERVGAMLEDVARDFAAEDGPVFRIRRLHLALWLDAARLNDAEIARSWAASLARALHRQIAEGGPSRVMRYPSHAAFLAAYLSDLAGGRVSGRWEYQEFHTLEDLPAGRAAAFVLCRDSRWIGPVFRILAEVHRLDFVIAPFTAQDVEGLWRSWTNSAPVAPPWIEPGLVARAFGLVPEPPATEPGGADARARTALRWLIALSTGPRALPPPVAGGLALQIGHLAALVAAIPHLREALHEGLAFDLPIRELAASADLSAAAAWLEGAIGRRDGEAHLTSLLSLIEGRKPTPRALRRSEVRPDRIVSTFAGAALLLPAIRQLGLAHRLGPVGLQLLLAAAMTTRHRILARGDLGLCWMSGLPEQLPTDPILKIDWPDAEDLGLDPAGLVRDAATHGDGPELPALRSVLDAFATGLRGMPGSSAAYLSAQFLVRSGTLIRDDDTLLVRLTSVPLRILLQMNGRLGGQGPLDWLDGRELFVEVADG
jgi:hypothetical protein